MLDQASDPAARHSKVATQAVLSHSICPRDVAGSLPELPRRNSTILKPLLDMT
jgi:hypothetical protein